MDEITKKGHYGKPKEEIGTKRRRDLLVRRSVRGVKVRVVHTKLNSLKGIQYDVWTSRKREANRDRTERKSLRTVIDTRVGKRWRKDVRVKSHTSATS